MATTTTWAVARVALGVAMMTAGATWADALATPGVRVVLHVTDRAAVPAEVMAKAERLVELVYGTIGIALVWTQGAAALAPADGDDLHLDVLMLSSDAVRQKCLADQIGDGVLGVAYRTAKRAYVFFGRIANEATQTSADAGLLLGLVVAHEVGHLLLPALSHSSEGLMRARWQGRLSAMPGFTGEQAATIRARLTARRHQP